MSILYNHKSWLKIAMGTAWPWCFVRIITLWILTPSVWAQNEVTNTYHTNRVFTPVTFAITGTPTVFQIYTMAQQLTSVVKGTNIITNAVYATERQSVALGHDSSSQAYAAGWRDKLGSMFEKYPTGFDCNCMPEEGPVERLVIYLCKYVSSPPISIRRIEGYDGQNVTYRYKDHRRGEVKETITAVEFIGRMIRHLPPKGFRMVRYYGIYARPVREKIHALVATVLKNLVDCARKVAQYFAGKNGKSTDEYQKRLDERFGKGDVCCPECGEKMTLIKIWSKKRGIIYDAVKDGSRTSQDLSSQRYDKAAQEKNAPGLNEQLSFGFLTSLA